jgi:hypothetical protein
MDTPRLIEDTAKNYLYATLQKVHATRVKYYNIVYNLFVFVVFVCVTGGVLYYLYRTKKTPNERNHKLMKDQEYVLSKIRYYQEQKQKIDEQASSYSSMITDLPVIAPQVLGI